MSSSSAASSRALYRTLVREIRRSALPRLPLSPRTDPLQTYVHGVFARGSEDVLHLAASPAPIGKPGSSSSSVQRSASQALPSDAEGAGDAFAAKGWKAARGWEEGQSEAGVTEIGIQETDEVGERLRAEKQGSEWRDASGHRVPRWRVEMEDLKTYLLARRKHLELLARYNPTHDQTEQERVRATVNRVGLEIPTEYVPKSGSEAPHQEK